MGWRKTERTLPMLDTPVWLYENDRMYIGERNMPPDADGWLWAVHYSIPWWNGEAWIGDTAEIDDVHPTHWKSLPMPPNA